MTTSMAPHMRVEAFCLGSFVLEITSERKPAGNEWPIRCQVRKQHRGEFPGADTSPKAASTRTKSLDMAIDRLAAEEIDAVEFVQLLRRQFRHREVR